jgi:hypothetical protein
MSWLANEIPAFSLLRRSAAFRITTGEEGEVVFSLLCLLWFLVPGYISLSELYRF